jgi:hypothetical protein
MIATRHLRSLAAVGFCLGRLMLPLIATAGTDCESGERRSPAGEYLPGLLGLIAGAHWEYGSPANVSTFADERGLIGAQENPAG